MSYYTLIFTLRTMDHELQVLMFFSINEEKMFSLLYKQNHDPKLQS